MAVKMGFLPLAVLLGVNAVMGAVAQLAPLFLGKNAPKSGQMGAIHYGLPANWECRDISSDTRLFYPITAQGERPGVAVYLTHIGARPDADLPTFLGEAMNEDVQGERVVYRSPAQRANMGDLGSGISVMQETEDAGGARTITRYWVTRTGGEYYVTRFQAANREANNRYLPEYGQLISSLKTDTPSDTALASTASLPTME